MTKDQLRGILTILATIAVAIVLWPILKHMVGYVTGETINLAEMGVFIYGGGPIFAILFIFLGYLVICFIITAIIVGPLLDTYF